MAVDTTSAEQGVRKRLSELIAHADLLWEKQDSTNFSDATLGEADALLAGSRALMAKFLPSDDEYRKAIEKLTFDTQRYSLDILNSDAAAKNLTVLSKLRSLLRHAQEDVECGLVASVAVRAQAELLDDFLEYANSNLSKDRLIVPAILIGATFEEMIKRLCGAHGIAITKADKLHALVEALRAKGVLSDAEFFQAGETRKLRNEAMHELNPKLDEKVVEESLQFVRRVLAPKLGVRT